MSGKYRVSTLLVAMVVALVASACNGGAQPPAAQVTSPQAIPSSGEAALTAGTYFFDNAEVGFAGKAFPKVLITVPDGWTSFGYGVHRYTGTDGYLAASFWNVGDVYANSCHWLGATIHAGPTVDDLAAVIATRPLRNATAPVAVSLGGYHGKYLEWSVPIDMNFSECDSGYFRSWTAADGGDRYQQGPGQVDRLWILDVDGNRLVIDVTYMPVATELDKAELAKVVDSIGFKS